MHVLLIRLSLHIPMSHSLKDKRREIRSLKDKISTRFNASVAEVDKLDSWQSSVLAVCMVSNERSYLEKQYSAIHTLVMEYGQLELLDIQREWL